jgi:hypothetical protein
MAEDQILRSGWSTNRICLHKSHPVERSSESSGFEKVPRYCKSAQITEVDQHPSIVPKVVKIHSIA